MTKELESQREQERKLVEKLYRMLPPVKKRLFASLVELKASQNAEMKAVLSVIEPNDRKSA